MSSLFSFFLKNPISLTFLAALFMVSGIIVNLIQGALYVLLWYVRRDLFRYINSYVVQLYWAETMFFLQWWCRTRMRLYCDGGNIHELFEHLRYENGLALVNHRSDIDFLFGWLLLFSFGALGRSKGLCKDSFILVPGLGFSCWLSEYVFLRRSWNCDQGPLRATCQGLHNYPFPFMLVMFPEGTRFTQEKSAKAQDWCKENNLPVFRHVLRPRTKGWNLIVHEMMDAVDSVWDITLAFPEQLPSVQSLIYGQDLHVDAYVRRTPMSEISLQGDDAVGFCINTFQQMDDRLDDYYNNGYSFGDQPYTIPRWRMPLAVQSLWVFGALYLAFAHVLPGAYAGEIFHIAVLGIFTLLGFIMFLSVLYVAAKSRKYAKRKDTEPMTPLKAQNVRRRRPVTPIQYSNNEIWEVCSPRSPLQAFR